MQLRIMGTYAGSSCEEKTKKPFTKTFESRVFLLVLARASMLYTKSHRQTSQAKRMLELKVLISDKHHPVKMEFITNRSHFKETPLAITATKKLNV